MRPKKLTKRQIDTLRLLAEGLSTREIARRLCVAEYTAQDHVRSVLAELGFNNRTKAAVYAVRAGIA